LACDTVCCHIYYFQTGYWQSFAVPVKTVGADPVDNIFGWMSVKEAAETAGINTDKFLKASGLPENTPLDHTAEETSRR